MDIVSIQAAEIKALKEKLMALEKRPEYTQEHLDEYTKNHYAFECGAYYASIKEHGANVYMVPMVKETNQNYKFKHPDGTIKKYENPRYKEDLAKWNEFIDLAHKELVLNPFTDYCDIRSIRVDRHNPASKFRNTNNPTNPDDKYTYSFNLFNMEHVNLMKASFGIDLKRIYTKETWEREIPADVRRGFAYIETIHANLNKHKADNLKILAVSDPQGYSSTIVERMIHQAEHNIYTDQSPVTGEHYFHHTINKWIDHLLLEKTTTSQGEK